MTVNDITYEIRGAIYDVYVALGPGLLVNFNTDNILTSIDRIMN